ncbi:MAG TPA: response regulator [Bdellovibrionales bacterium]|nr:response regulator [Bdellovibrionales bacterium]
MGILGGNQDSSGGTAIQASGRILTSVHRGRDHLVETMSCGEWPDAADAIGKPLRDAWPDADPAFLGALDRVYSTGLELHVDSFTTGFRLGLSPSNWHLKISPLKDKNNQVTGVAVFAVDTTFFTRMRDQATREARRLRHELNEAREAANAATRAKSWFLTNVSHEIRTPLNAIMGFTELLATGAVKRDEKQKYMDAVRRNGEILSRLVGDVLELSILENGQLPIRSERVSPWLIAREIEADLSARALERGLRFTVAADSVLPEAILTDSVRFRQVLTQLVENGLKFTLRGEVSLRLAWLERENILDCRVVDTGTGIAPVHATKLFQPFAQIDASSTRRHGGSGLGLDISRRLARAMGGDVELEWSEPGRGSTFRFWIKTKGAEMVARPSPASTRDSTARRPLDGSRILVVEDAPDNRALVGKFLTLAGAQVEFAVNGLEGVEKALKKSFDVILMDIQMPELDGYEATAHLRWKKYAGPILALTAHALAEERDRCFRVGCNEHLTKPVDRHVLVDTISRYVHRDN